jgi:hypothetical protein
MTVSFTRSIHSHSLDDAHHGLVWFNRLEMAALACRPFHSPQKQRRVVDWQAVHGKSR